MAFEDLDDIGRLVRAMHFAADRHRDQRRKDVDASPYINHPIALADVLASSGDVRDTDVLCAALLHDTIEDTQTSPDDLAERFGPRITSIVLEVTDDRSLPKEERKRRQIEHAAHASHEAKLVKLADKICNLRDVLDSQPQDWTVARRVEYLDWARDVIEGVRGTHAGLEAIFDDLYARRDELLARP